VRVGIVEVNANISFKLIIMEYRDNSVNPHGLDLFGFDKESQVKVTVVFASHLNGFIATDNVSDYHRCK